MSDTGSPESILPKDHPCHACFKLADWFQKRRLLNNFPIGSYVKTMSADGGHFEPRSGSLNTILEVDHLRPIDDKNPMAVWDLNSNLDVFGMQTFLRGLIYVR
jgi:hypothetical protein